MSISPIRNGFIRGLRPLRTTASILLLAVLSGYLVQAQAQNESIGPVSSPDRKVARARADLRSTSDRPVFAGQAAELSLLQYRIRAPGANDGSE